ncbi:hypothetical protein CAOG_09031, partial [Capsaspora owczarzaki ATCC 30864]
ELLSSREGRLRRRPLSTPQSLPDSNRADWRNFDEVTLDADAKFLTVDTSQSKQPMVHFAILKPPSRANGVIAATEWMKGVRTADCKATVATSDAIIETVSIRSRLNGASSSESASLAHDSPLRNAVMHWKPHGLHTVSAGVFVTADSLDDCLLRQRRQGELMAMQGLTTIDDRPTTTQNKIARLHVPLLPRRIDTLVEQGLTHRLDYAVGGWVLGGLDAATVQHLIDARQKGQITSHYRLHTSPGLQLQRVLADFVLESNGGATQQELDLTQLSNFGVGAAAQRLDADWVQIRIMSDFSGTNYRPMQGDGYMTRLLIPAKQIAERAKSWTVYASIVRGHRRQVRAHTAWLQLFITGDEYFQEPIATYNLGLVTRRQASSETKHDAVTIQMQCVGYTLQGQLVLGM